MLKKRELPCVHRLRSLYRKRTVPGAVSMSIEKKSVEEAKKNQRKRFTGKVDLCSLPKAEFQTSLGLQPKKKGSIQCAYHTKW
jgi:hypothetical protein